MRVEGGTIFVGIKHLSERCCSLSPDKEPLVATTYDERHVLGRHPLAMQKLRVSGGAGDLLTKALKPR